MSKAGLTKCHQVPVEKQSTEDSRMGPLKNVDGLMDDSDQRKQETIITTNLNMAAKSIPEHVLSHNDDNTVKASWSPLAAKIRDSPSKIQYAVTMRSTGSPKLGVFLLPTYISRANITRPKRKCSSNFFMSIRHGCRYKFCEQISLPTKAIQAD